jgi:hypothetical protein
MSSQQNSNLDQTGNTLAPFPGNVNGVNIQQASINNAGVSTNTAPPAPQNTIFEVYLPLNGRIYYITYQCTELNILQIARLLNNGVYLSHIPDD